MRSNFTCLLLLTLALDVLTQTPGSSQICLKDTEFKACVNKYSLQIARCPTAKGLPDLAYYQCQCTSYTDMEQCYFLCPDDAQLQLQFRDMKQTKSTVCQSVDDLRNQGFKESSSTTATSTKASTSSTRSGPPPTATVDEKKPPQDTGSTTSGGGSQTVASGGSGGPPPQATLDMTSGSLSRYTFHLSLLFSIAYTMFMTSLFMPHRTL